MEQERQRVPVAVQCPPTREHSQPSSALGMSMTIGFLGPCGYNTPHTHPRATEFNFAVNGTLQAGILTENGARFVFNEVNPGSAAIFPNGAIHFEMNNECGMF